MQILTSPPSPVSNPSSALPSPIIVVPPTPEQLHEPQPSTSTASYAPPRPRPSQSTFRHVGPSGMSGGRPYTHSPLRPAHRDTALASPATPATGTVFRTLTPSTGKVTPAGSPQIASPAPGTAHALPPRTFTLSQQGRTSSPLASSSVITPGNSGSLPVTQIGQRGGTAPPASASASSRLASPAPLPAAPLATTPLSHTEEAPAAPLPPSKGPTPSPTPSTPHKALPVVPQTQMTPPERPVSLPRHAGHTPTHSNTLPVHLPSSSAPISRSTTPVSTPPQRASGSTPYRAGFQPKGVYRLHTDEFLESRARKREIGKVEQRRLERRLDKVCSIAILECLLADIIRGDTDFYLFFISIYIILSMVYPIHSSSVCTSRILRRPQARMHANPNQRSHQCRHLPDVLPVSLILIWVA